MSNFINRSQSDKEINFSNTVQSDFTNTHNKEADEKTLPFALSNLIIKDCIGGIAIVLFSIGFSVAVRDKNPLLLSIAGVWLFFKGITISRDYYAGKIIEKHVICLNVQPARFSDTMSVVFMTEGTDGQEEHFQFSITGKKKSDKFIQNGFYKIYMYSKTPAMILTFVSDAR